MSKDKQLKPDVNLGEQELIFERIEQQAVDLYIVLELLTSPLTTEFLWDEICAIPQETFSLLKNLPHITDVLQEKLSNNTISAGANQTFFSVELKPHINCAKDGQISPLKAQFLARSERKAQSNPTLAFDGSLVVDAYRKSLNKKILLLLNQAEEQVESLESYLATNIGADTEKNRALALKNKYLELIAFSSATHQKPVPFAHRLIVERISTLYSDIEHWVGDLQQRAHPRPSVKFWRAIVKNAYYVFYLYFDTVPDHVLHHWRSIETAFMLLDYEDRFRLAGAVDTAFLEDYVDDNYLTSLKESLFATFEAINENIKDQEKVEDALLTLEDIALGFQQAHCAYLSAENITSGKGLSITTNDAGEAPQKKNKGDNPTINQKSKDTYSYLHDFSFALFIFYGRVKLLESTPLAIRSSNDIEEHDNKYLKTSISLLWMNRLISMISAHKAPLDAEVGPEAKYYHYFLNVISQFQVQCQNQIFALSKLRNQFLIDLLKRLKNTVNEHETLYSEGGIEADVLLSPTWIEFDEKQCRLRVYSDILSSFGVLNAQVSSLLKSIELTNKQTRLSHDYPMVSAQLITTLQNYQQWLVDHRMRVAVQVFSLSHHWLEKVKLCCSLAGALTSLQEVLDTTHFLGLFSLSRKVLLEHLSTIFSMTGDGNVRDLINKIEAFPSENCKAALTKMHHSPAIIDFGKQLSDRIVAVKRSVQTVPNVLNSFMRFLTLTDADNVGKSMESCVESSHLLATVSHENQSLLNDITSLKVFFDISGINSDVEKWGHNLHEADKEVLQVQDYFSELWLLYENRKKCSNKLDATVVLSVTLCFKKIWTTLKNSDQTLKNANDTIMKATPENRHLISNACCALESEYAHCLSLIKELQEDTSLGGDIMLGLKKSNSNFSGVTTTALTYASHHLERQATQMKGLLDKAKPLLGEEPINRPASKC